MVQQFKVEECALWSGSDLVLACQGLFGLLLLVAVLRVENQRKGEIDEVKEEEDVVSYISNVRKLSCC